MQIKNEFM